VLIEHYAADRHVPWNNHQTPDAIDNHAHSRFLLFLLAESLLCRLATLPYPLQNRFPILVELEFCNDNLGSGDAEGHGLAIGLFADETLDVNDV
jgi:hypothetical protein